MTSVRKHRILAAFLLLLTSAKGQNLSSPYWQRQLYTTDNGLPQNTIHALLQSRNGFLYVATEGGLARFDGQQFQIFNTENSGIPSNDGRDLAEEADGSIWLATAGGAARLQNGRVLAYGAEQGMGNLNVQRWIQSSSGLLALTPNGAYRWNGTRWEASLTPPPQANRLSQKELAAGLDASDPLLAAGILCRLQDREGNIWIGTESSGLAILRRSRFTLLGTRQGLGSDSLRCVFQTRDGAMWFGTDGAGLDRLQSNRWTHFTTADGLSSNVIIALGEDVDGDLLAGTPDGLNRIRGTAIRVFTSADGLADDFVRSVAFDGSSLYVGTRRGLARIGRNGQIATFNVGNGLPSNLVGAMLPVGKDDIWIATLQGLVHLRGQRFTTFSTRDHLRSETVTALYKDSAGVIWVGTQGGSLHWLSGAGILSVHTRGLPSNIFGIGEDAGGSLWMSGNGGLYRANRNDLLRSEGEATVYGTADGLRLNEGSRGGAHPTVWHAGDGTLWFATARGAVSIRPEQAAPNEVAPPLVIESLVLDDTRVSTEGRNDLHLKPGPSRYAFEFTAPSFIATQKIRFTYRLEPFDREWVDAGPRRAAFYTNLPPGRYTFRVRARNGDGVWNWQGAALKLTLQPPFYRTFWFYALCAVASACLLYMAYRWRERRMQKQFDAVIAERTRIAREIHDTLAQGFAGISVQLEIVSKLLVNGAQSSPAAILQHLQAARTLVRDSLTEARRSIWQLRYENSGEQDLRARLGKLTQSSHEGHGEPRITLDIQGAFRPLEPGVEAELLRIAQEAVRNAIRHAHASTVRIALEFSISGRVRLSVSDNGHGFDVAQVQNPREGHWGVAGMRERARSIGAELEVESTTKGTAVCVEVAAP